MRRMEEFKWPKLFTVSGYIVYFWSNEEGEPIHVHISKGKPSPNATKIWITRTGGCIVANNGSKIPNKELNELMEFISARFFLYVLNGNSFLLQIPLNFIVKIIVENIIF